MNIEDIYTVRTRNWGKTKEPRRRKKALNKAMADTTRGGGETGGMKTKEQEEWDNKNFATKASSKKGPNALRAGNRRLCVVTGNDKQKNKKNKR